MHDVVVVGGGHNGLAAAAYLARAGRSVLVLERRGAFGGAAVSERPWPGVDARLSRFSYLVSLLPGAVVRELGLRVRLADRPVAAYADGLLVEADARSARTRASFPSPAEHDAFLAWGALLEAAAGRFWPTVTEPLPDAARARALLGDEVWRALVDAPLGVALRERFAHPLVRGMVATDALIGTFASLDDPSLVQNRCFLFHVVGGGDGRWRVPVGGMGAVSGELERAAREAGAELRTGCEVLDVDGTTVTFRDAAGEHAVGAAWVLLGCATGAAARPAVGAQLKVNLLLDRLPALRDGTPPELAFAGTFRVHERWEQLEAAWAAAARGEVPAEPPAELYCHTLTDRSILGEGLPATAQTLTVFALHATAEALAPPGARDLWVDRVLDGLDAVCAEPVRPLLHRDGDGAPCLEAKGPAELEAELGLPGGHIFHGDLAWPWLGGDDDDDRAPGGRWGVATGDPRVLVCGAGARRGGGVSALGGRDAAMAVLGR